MKMVRPRSSNNPVVREPNSDDSSDDNRWDYPVLDPAKDPTWPLKRHKQVALVERFQKSYDQQSIFWKKLFQIFFCLIISFLGYSMYAQFTSPWQMKFHAIFEDQVEEEMVIIVDGVAAIACLMAVYAFSRHCENERRSLLISSFLGIAMGLFWLYHMIRAPKFRWELMWRPLIPSSCFLASLYVDRILAEFQDTIQKLQEYIE